MVPTPVFISVRVFKQLACLGRLLWDGDYGISYTTAIRRDNFQGNYCYNRGMHFGINTPSLLVSGH